MLTSSLSAIVGAPTFSFRVRRLRHGHELSDEGFNPWKNEIGHGTQGYRRGSPFQRKIVAAHERNDSHQDRSAHYVRESRLSPRNPERPLRFGLDFAKFPCSKHGQDGHQAAQPDIDRE